MATRGLGMIGRILDLTATDGARAPHTREARPSDRRAPWVGPLRTLGFPVAIAVVLASMALLVAYGYGLIALVSMVALILALPLMQVLPIHLPPLNHLGTRNLTKVEVETRVLIGYALLYPLLLIPVVIAARSVPATLVPGANSPLLSPIYVVFGKVLLLAVPAVLIAARMGQLGRQLGLRRINTRWRWLGPVVPFVLVMFALGALGADGRMPLAPLAYLLAVPLAVVSVGFPEESFYRVLLQTRLELLLGTRSGIAVAALLFALMQVPIRFAFVWSALEPDMGRALLLSVATAFGYQAVMGVIYGYMWMRYRNAWLNVAGHSAFDAVALAGLIVC